MSGTINGQVILTSSQHEFAFLKYATPVLLRLFYFLQAKDKLKETSIKEYKGLGSMEVTSLAWNIVMIKVNHFLLVESSIHVS